MRTKSWIAAASVTVLALATACAQQDQYGRQTGGLNKETVGTGLGAVAGGLIGSQIGGGSGRLWAVGAGTLLGAALGNQIGASMDRQDMMYYNQASSRALEYSQPGETLPWRNPESGNHGTITPSNYYQTAQGEYCREYTQTIYVAGERAQGHGTACRNPDGTWQIVE